MIRLEKLAEDLNFSARDAKATCVLSHVATNEELEQETISEGLATVIALWSVLDTMGIDRESKQDKILRLTGNSIKNLVNKDKWNSVALQILDNQYVSLNVWPNVYDIESEKLEKKSVELPLIAVGISIHGIRKRLVEPSMESESA